MKSRIKNPVTRPLTRDEVETLVNEIALTLNNRRRTVAKLDAKKLAVDEEFAPTLAIYDEAIKAKTDQVQLWAESNPDAFGKLKSIAFAAGTIGFRTGTPKLALLNRSWNWDKVCDAVQQFLPAFIRNKPEVDKEQIIAQRDEVEFILPQCGVKITQAESFFIEPNLTDTDARQVVKEAA